MNVRGDARERSGVWRKPFPAVHDVEKRREEIVRNNRIAGIQDVNGAFGTVDEVAHIMAEYYKAGIRGILLGMPAPYDRETIERVIKEVRPRVLEMVAATGARR